MARPTKNNAEYFSHDSDMRNDMRIKALRRKYSHKGYAVWCFMLEVLTDSDFFEITWSDINIELLSADFDVSIEELEDIKDYCVKLGLFQCQNNTLSSESHKNRFSGLLKKREYNKSRVSVTETEFDKHSCDNNSHSKGKYSIENNSKGNNNESNKLDSSENDFSDGSNSLNNQSDIDGNTEKEKSSAKKEKVDFTAIVELYHNSCPSFPRILKLSDARKQKIKIRLDEMKGDFDLLEKVFLSMEKSKFLRGENKDGWQATFDWLFANPNNWVKIIEGNYNDKSNKGGKSINVNDIWEK